jgi:hypothetical protein
LLIFNVNGSKLTLGWMNCYAENIHVYFSKTIMKYIWNKYIYIQIIRITVFSKNNYIIYYVLEVYSE